MSGRIPSWPSLQAKPRTRIRMVRTPSQASSTRCVEDCHAERSEGSGHSRAPHRPPTQIARYASNGIVNA
jgi:hypothetical protein